MLRLSKEPGDGERRKTRSPPVGGEGEVRMKDNRDEGRITHKSEI